MLCADDRITFASIWDPHWKVATVFGKELVIVHDKFKKIKNSQPREGETGKTTC